MRKHAFCICENKDADQLHVNRMYVDSTIPLVSKFEMSSLFSLSVAIQPGLCRTWSETSKTCFLTTWLKCTYCVFVPEPDVGMPEVDANRYFKQLLRGVVGSPCSFSCLEVEPYSF